MSGLDLEDIRAAVEASGLKDFSGDFAPLGGGDMNDAFVLRCGSENVVLRVAKRPAQRILQNEARALSLLDLPQVPKLLYFDERVLIRDRLWILESYVAGSPVSRLNLDQFRQLGVLLALIHQTTKPNREGINLWGWLLNEWRFFGDERSFLDHPDQRLRALIRSGRDYANARQAAFEQPTLSLLHGDATMSNTLVTGSSVSLVDWEFSSFSDPMVEFPKVYFDDMELNQGKWGVHITSAERLSLFDGYRSGGGRIDERRLAVWMVLCKLRGAVFFYWRMNQSGHGQSQEQLEQFQVDYDNLIRSLGSVL